MSVDRATTLGAFLRTRRAQLTPAAVGLPRSDARRRVRGLRREEVAMLASISTDYYTRIEQGRRPASLGVLDALARGLQLDPDQRAYLFELAGKDDVHPPPSSPQRLRPALRTLLDELTFTPALVVGPRMEILAWNSLAAALMVDFGALPASDRNYVRLLFDSPAMRNLYPSWEAVAITCLGHLRMSASRYPDDPELNALIDEMSARHETFRTLWAAHHVAVRNVGSKVFRHPIIGDVTLQWDTLASVSDPDQELILWTARAGSHSEQALRMLADMTTAANGRNSSPATPLPTPAERRSAAG
ncbi:helix-turn-helix domain-containing protein [Micropruina sp.]|uniref:helix-turn-helix domain-containing protein n=1 Tax=Micropruina sp. TaxID=2737536 RepID=UPI0039E723F8